MTRTRLRSSDLYTEQVSFDFELPEGWAAAHLQELIASDGVFSDGDWIESKDQDPKGGVRLIQLADVGDGFYKNKSERFLTRGKAEELDCTFLQPGDVLVARLPDPLGRACIFPGDQKPSVTAVDICILRTGENGVNHKWLMSAVNSPVTRRAFEELQKGTTRQRIARSDLASLALPVPPLAEQKRIVAKIDELSKRVGAARERLSKTVLILKRFRQAVLASACSGRLTEDWRDEHRGTLPASELLGRIRVECQREGAAESELDLPEIPETWAWSRFGFLLGELRNGISTRPNLDPPGTKILRISSVRPRLVSLDENRYLPKAHDLVPVYRLRNDDLLFTRYNGSLELLGVCGMVRQLTEDLLYPDKLMRVRFDHAYVLPRFVEIFFQSRGARERLLEKSKSSAGQQGLSGADLKAQPITLPPVEEQLEIACRVEVLFNQADAIELRVAAAVKRAEKLTQAILAKTFRGELVPTEAELARREGREYESASALLERIRTEQERRNVSTASDGSTGGRKKRGRVRES